MPLRMHRITFPFTINTMLSSMSLKQIVKRKKILETLLTDLVKSCWSQTYKKKPRRRKMGNSDATGPLPLMVTFPLSTSGCMEYDLPMKTHSDRVIRFIKINIHQPMSPSTSPIDRDPQSTPTIPNQSRLHCRNFPCALSPPKHTDIWRWVRK